MMHLLFAILFILAGCGNDVASSHDVAPFSAGSESSALEESSSSAHNVVSELSSDDAHISSAEMLPVESSSSLSHLEQSSSSEGIEFSSSSSKCWAEPSSFWCPESSSSSSSVLVVVYGEMTDERDGQTYKTVKVNDNVTWMAENLNYAYLQPTAELDSSSWCGDFWNEDGCDVYGRLYLWSAAVDSAALFSDAMKGCGYYESSENWQKCPLDQNVRGVCPEGWKLPTYDDYINLMSWRVSYPPINFKEEQLGDFIKLKNNYYASTYFWLVTEKDFARGFLDRYSETSLEYSEGASIIDLRITEKKEFHTVRCVKDEEMNEE